MINGNSRYLFQQKVGEIMENPPIFTQKIHENPMSRCGSVPEMDRSGVAARGVNQGRLDDGPLGEAAVAMGECVFLMWLPYGKLTV